MAGKLTHLDVFSGIGGFALGLRWAGGFDTVAFCEIDPFCQQVLRKHWPSTPIHGDVRTLTREAAGPGPIDILTAGVPCQPASQAGKRRGASDDRWLWPEALRLVEMFRPRWCLFENPTGILGMAEYPGILSCLEELGYEVWPLEIPAAAVGAPHRRARVWLAAHMQGVSCNGGATQKPGRDTAGRGVSTGGRGGPVADTNGNRQQQQGGLQQEGGRWPGDGRQDVADPANVRCENYPCGPSETSGPEGERPWVQESERVSARIPESDLGRVHDGLSEALDVAGWGPDWETGIPRTVTPRKGDNRAARLKALGNAVVPQIPMLIGIAIMQAEGIDHG